MLHFIHYQPITISKITAGASGICSGKINYFTFSFIRGSLRVGLLAISVSMCVALTLSYLTITCHIVYITCSRTFVFFNILGGVKCTHVISTSRCIYTCPVWSGMVWAIRFKALNSEDWSFLSQSKHMKWPGVNHRCKQAQRETCVLSQAQQSFTSLMNRSNTDHL